MIAIHKKLVVDELGNPTDVIIPWGEFLEISQMLALDLDAAAIADLEQAQTDRISGNKDAYLSLEDI